MDEKDPIVRSYLENLRGQVAAIALKYGVNARDVFRVDVQERMGVDDFVEVAELVKRIGMFGEGKVPLVAAREMVGDLNRRERQAVETLRITMRVVGLGSREESERLFVALMREGLVDLAEEFVEGLQGSEELFEADIMIVRAQGIENMDVPRARELVERALDRIYANATAAPGEIPYALTLQNGRLFARAYALRLRLMEPEKLLAEMAVLWKQDTCFIPIAIELLSMEREQRGNPLSEEDEEMLFEFSERVLSEVLDSTALPTARIIRAEIYFENGADPEPVLEHAISEMRRIGATVSTMRKRIDLIARTAGKFGMSRVIVPVMRDPWWQLSVPEGHLWGEIGLGCVEAGNLKTALELLRTHAEMSADEKRELASAIIRAMLETGDVSGADRLIEEYRDYHLPGSWRASFEYDVAFARRGEDISERIERDLPRWRGKPTYSLAMALASVATIQFTRTMRERVAMETTPKPSLGA